MLQPQQLPLSSRTSLVAARAKGGELCSNLNYKPQTESHQQQSVLYMKRYLLSVVIMIEVTSRHMECAHSNLDYRRMPTVELQRHLTCY